ncbi:DUF4153 domain-containing protein [Butyrivibrio sp. X503]|uniref:DUF4153 domain-containing protein n=1 Tax=Butyrivibrio sp. X503 TaxID=2364878 RepID=UPI000EA86002|nr:DUF4153 domain-containing protein [Butyrivibrio sp. X503]RKM57000.1 DUF4153 domain-containing protein [Butyrivibrio sp. X503]
MLGFKKLKNVFKQILKRHPVSFFSVLISMILFCITYDGFDRYEAAKDVMDVIAIAFFVFAFGALVCEVYRECKRKSEPTYSFDNKKYIITNVAVLAFSALLGAFSALFNVYNSVEISGMCGVNELLVRQISDYVIRFTVVLVVAAVCVSLFFFYKKSMCSFETYTAKAFCGVMKAELVFFVIAIGLTLIITAFNALLFELDSSVYIRLWIVLLGLVQYPCLLSGLSNTDEEISKFGKVMLTYVLPGLLAISFLIVYAYIIKILVTFSFPSNQVFPILTSLFFIGALIWTMAQGIRDKSLRKVFRIMPLLFIPFIVLQIISLSIRISGYGLTVNRYVGIAVVVFELIYCILYVINMIRKKEAMQAILAVVAVIFFAALLVPGINVYSAVIASQKGRIIKYISNPDKAGSRTIREAHEAYITLNMDCGVPGQVYIEKNYSEDQMAELEELVENINYVNGIYVFRSNDSHFKIKGSYTDLYTVKIFYDKTDGIDPMKDELEIYSGDKVIDKVRLGNVISELLRLSATGAEEQKLENVINKNIQLKNGGEFIIVDIDICTNYNTEIIDSIDVNGYVVK